MSIAEKLTTIAENEQKVFEAGKQAENEKFWDNAFNYGNRTDLTRAFGSYVWNEENFKPTSKSFPKKILKLDYCFYNSLINGDLVEILNGLGIILDTTYVYTATQVFRNTLFTRVGELLFSDSRQNYNYMFTDSEVLETIDKLVITNDGTHTFTNTFNYCAALKNIIIEGVIGTTFDIKYSPLTVKSAKSIINCLKDYSGTDSEYDYTVYFSGDTLALLEAEGATAPNGYTWLEYARDIKCWNI